MPDHSLAQGSSPCPRTKVDESSMRNGRPNGRRGGQAKFHRPPRGWRRQGSVSKKQGGVDDKCLYLPNRFRCSFPRGGWARDVDRSEAKRTAGSPRPGNVHVHTGWPAFSATGKTLSHAPAPSLPPGTFNPCRAWRWIEFARVLDEDRRRRKAKEVNV